MATASQWIAGARPRTLPAAVAPVATGCGVAAAQDSFIAGRALLALAVALALQVGVNYANDYSDGIRGTDDVRVGPVRLVGQQLAEPRAVKRAALAALGVAAALGLLLVVLAQAWLWLLVGAAGIAAAWLYTGGPRPYGYAGLGEVFVFTFFGPVAVIGTAYVQTGAMSWLAVATSIPIGILTALILIANNLRDIPSDRLVGKRTLAVVLGDAGTRTLFLVGAIVAYVDRARRRRHAPGGARGAGGRGTDGGRGARCARRGQRTEPHPGPRPHVHGRTTDGTRTRPGPGPRRLGNPHPPRGSRRRCAG